MFLTLNGFIDYLTETIKQNQTGPVECTWCNNSANIIKYGIYHRYAFTGGELIPIQRYLCKHELCKRTFSIFYLILFCALPGFLYVFSGYC